VLLEAAGNADAKLRAISVSGLAASARSDEAAAKALRAAISDPEVPVRLAAIAGMRGAGVPGETEAQLVGASGTDPWPAVRAAIAALAPDLSSERAAEILSRALRDPAAQVRLAGLSSAPRVDGDAIDGLVVERLSAAGEEPRVRAAAARTARARCIESAAQPLYEVLRKGAEPLAELRDVDAAVAAAGALGAIGGARSEELLRKARQRSNPTTDAAIDAALVRIGQECGSGDGEQPGQ
jgi:HEAT repeat protein